MIDDLEKMLKAAFDGTDVRVIRCDEDGMTEITTPSQTTAYYPDQLRTLFPDWHLVDKNSMQEMLIGEILRDSADDEWTLIGARPPHKPESTGRVYVEDEDGTREFFPSVFDLKWYHKSEVKKDV